MNDTPRDLVSREIGALITIPIEPASHAISAGETMTFDPARPEMYFFHGKSAMRLVLSVLSLLGRDSASVGSILDFACGHGRVTRYFRSCFPQAAIMASDVDQAGVKFCADTFGAEPHISTGGSIEAIDFGKKFDLIWVGSLLTHVDIPEWYRFVDLWQRSLKPGGVLIFTYASTYVRYLARAGEFGNLDQTALARATQAFDESGFGYMPYKPGGSFGQTLASEQWVANFMSRYPALRSVLHFERGWGARQNVMAVTLDRVGALIAEGR
jgi:SAM-dependent methyltransferase